MKSHFFNSVTLPAHKWFCTVFFFCILNFISPGSTISNAEVSAICALLNARETIIYPEWTCDNVPLLGCTWSSIRCGSSSSVESIDFSNQKLSGTIPSRLGSLPSLRRLVLSNNKLIGTLPSELQSLTQLEELSVGGNNLVLDSLSFVLPLKNLNILDLSSNHVSGTIPNQIGFLTSLSVMNFENNLLSGTIPTTIGQLYLLSHLDLSYNAITGTIPTQIARLTFLETLNVGSNMLQGLVPTQIGQLTLAPLSSLDLSSNLLAGTIPYQLGKLYGLTALYINNNSFTGTLPTTLRALGMLESLNIASLKVEGCFTFRANALTFCDTSNILFKCTCAPPAERCGVVSCLLDDNTIGNNSVPELVFVPEPPSIPQPRPALSLSGIIIIAAGIPALVACLCLSGLFAGWLKYREPPPSSPHKRMQTFQSIPREL